MLCIGTATQDVFLAGKIFKPVNDDGVLEEQFELGAKLAVDQVTFATGGNAMNAAITFARQGLDTEFMGVLGTEPAGQSVMAMLDAEGVATHNVVQDDHYRTSYSTILLSPTGERTILNYKGTTLKGNGAPLDFDHMGEVDWVYLSSLKSLPLLNHIISWAHKHNVRVALNPSGAELEHPAKLKALLEDVSLLSLNKEEAQLLFEGKTMDELILHASHMVETVIISDGPRGSITSDGQTIVKAGMYEDVPVVDRTGAGDAFTSGFVAKIAQGAILEDAVTFASANSTSVVAQIGAPAGILHRGTKLHDMPLKVKALVR